VPQLPLGFLRLFAQPGGYVVLDDALRQPPKGAQLPTPQRPRPATPISCERLVNRPMPNELLITAPRAIAIAPYDDPPLGVDQVRADAMVSGISHGTEIALYRGISPFAGNRFDLDLRLFDEDADVAPYPMRPGYEWVGRVRSVGAEVGGIAPGDVMHATLPHRETQTVTIADDGSSPWLVLPAELEPDRAALLHSAAIALQAVHDARLKAGDRVAVFGLGTLGLLAVQLARVSGAGWIAAVDPIASRRSLAEAFGADCTLDPDRCDAGKEIKIAAGGKGVDVAIEFSGRYAALHQSMRSARLAGTVVAAGFYIAAAGSDLRLGEEFHHNRLTLVGSMSGWGAPHRAAGWNRRRLRTTALDLLVRERLDVDALITHRIPFERAADAYELVDKRPDETLRVVLTY
jgi:2-desacetyl-2-hydroxyethyl bacteriochlorophyllide A dehydrogenase